MHAAITLFHHEDAWKETSGAVFCLADCKAVKMFLGPTLLGFASSDDAEKYESRAREGAKFLIVNPRIDSWEAHEPRSTLNLVGAVRIEDTVFSMSGLPNGGNLAVMLAAACFYYDDPHAAVLAEQIAVALGNPYWARLALRLSVKPLLV